MRKKIYGNYRVTITPRRMTDYGYGSMSASLVYKQGGEQSEKYRKDMVERMQEIKADIKRHVDNVDNIAIEFDTIEVCEYCEETWEVDETGLPQCCAKAQEEWLKTEQGMKMKELQDLDVQQFPPSSSAGDLLMYDRNQWVPVSREDLHHSEKDNDNE